MGVGYAARCDGMSRVSEKWLAIFLLMHRRALHKIK